MNKYRLEKEDPLEILNVDNTAVRESQLRRLAKLKSERDESACRQSLERLTRAAAGETKENLLQLAIEATQARASLGEISDALEKVYGRHQAVIRSISGVYSSEYGDKDEVEKIRARTDRFAEAEGRRPRIMVAKMGQDGHDRGAKVVATAYADLGFDVDIGALFQTPEETAAQAAENDVHIVAMSSLAAGHKTLLPKLVEALKENGREDILVVAGGVIPAQDYDYLYEQGAAAIFGPGTIITESARKLLDLLEGQGE